MRNYSDNQEVIFICVNNRISFTTKVYFLLKNVTIKTINLYIVLLSGKIISSEI